MSNQGKFDDLLARSQPARWLHAKARIALIQAAATAKPLTKEELAADPFGKQLGQVQEARQALQDEKKEK
jgi:hypothetical protein